MEAEKFKEHFQPLAGVLEEFTRQVAVEELDAFADIFRIADGGGVVVEGLEVEFEDVAFAGMVAVYETIAQVEQILDGHRFDGEIFANPIDFLGGDLGTDDHADAFVFQDHLLGVVEEFSEIGGVVKIGGFLMFFAIFGEGTLDIVTEEIALLGTA
jgi:hypothetical protein